MAAHRSAISHSERAYCTSSSALDGASMRGASVTVTAQSTQRRLASFDSPRALSGNRVPHRGQYVIIYGTSRLTAASVAPTRPGQKAAIPVAGIGCPA